MNKTKFNKAVLRLVCVLAIAAMAVCTFGCEKKSNTLDVDTSGASVTEVGTGDTVFDFEVIDIDEKVTKFKVSTDKKIVGEALIDCGLIEGDEGPYGLYVKTVMDVTIDYDTDGMYWAFYVGDELAPKGVDLTEIVNGEAYRFVATKG